MSSILVSLDGTTVNCDLEDYPANIQYPGAVTYNNREVLACGGLDLEDADRCWSFNGSAWSALPNSRQKHCFVDSPNVFVNDGWWITGRDGSCSSSTSDVYAGLNGKPGPALPGDEYPRYSCVVNLNTTHTFLIGGGYQLTIHHLPVMSGCMTGTPRHGRGPAHSSKEDMPMDV